MTHGNQQPVESEAHVPVNLTQGEEEMKFEARINGHAPKRTVALDLLRF
jgi:hypothetical protein